MAGPGQFIKIGTRIETRLVDQRTLNRISNKSFRKVMETHKRDRLPEHFEENEKTRPGGAYGYEKRQEEYTKFKFQKKGHRIPLVLSGRMRSRAIKYSKVKATAKLGRLTIRIGHPIHAQQRDEIEAITSQERQDISSQYEKLLKDGIDDPRNQTKLRKDTATPSLG